MDQVVSFGENFSLTLLTDDPVIAERGDRAGIDHIGVDLETLGKRGRQPEPGAWISHHTIADLAAVACRLRRSRLFARTDPWHDGSPRQIDELLAGGVTALMLPMFTGAAEVARFVNLVAGRAYICLLLETPQAIVRIDDILGIAGIDEVSVGLNDWAYLPFRNSHQRPDEHVVRQGARARYPLRLRYARTGQGQRFAGAFRLGLRSVPPAGSYQRPTFQAIPWRRSPESGYCTGGEAIAGTAELLARPGRRGVGRSAA